MSNLREIRLEGAVKGSGLNMFRNKSLCSKDMQTESFSGRAQVLVNFSVSLFMTKQMWFYV